MRDGVDLGVLTSSDFSGQVNESRRVVAVGGTLRCSFYQRCSFKSFAR